MSRLKIARIALAVAATCLASQAFAAGPAGTLSVSAAVSGICKIITVPAMSFTIDPSSTSAATASSVVEYKCTKNTAPTSVTVGASSSPYSGSLVSPSVTSTMAYTVSWTDPTAAGNGFGAAAQTFTLSGSVAVAAFQNAEAATDYAATAAVAINP
jgi:spore coat protein U-like protein